MICHIKRILRLYFCIVVLFLLPLSPILAKGYDAFASYTDVLTDTISRVISTYPAEIGVAIIVNNRDTVAINNKPVYPLMSVFKVHQAIAICNEFDSKGLSLDSLIIIERDELDSETWSPMLKDYKKPVMRLTVRDLLRYALIQSDNNASNVMFKRLVCIEKTDSFIATLIPRSSFQITCTEADMKLDHSKAFSNYTSPLGAAMLFNRLFTDSLVNSASQCFIRESLSKCATGKDRIVKPLLDIDGVAVAHKTGSGYINEKGVLTAHNDVAYIILPNGVCYTLAIFVKGFKGNESLASKAIAHVSSLVYMILCNQRG